MAGQRRVVLDDDDDGDDNDDDNAKVCRVALLNFEGRLFL